MPEYVTNYKIAAWDEAIARDQESPQKCTTVRAHGTMSGDLTGDVQSSLTLAYIAPDCGKFNGFTYFQGSIGNRAGGFVLKDEGAFDPKSADTVWTIVKGSGTGDFSDLSGSGEYSAAQGMKITCHLTLNWPAE